VVLRLAEAPQGGSEVKVSEVKRRVDDLIILENPVVFWVTETTADNFMEGTYHADRNCPSLRGKNLEEVDMVKATLEGNDFEFDENYYRACKRCAKGEKT